QLTGDGKITVNYQEGEKSYMSYLFLQPGRFGLTEEELSCLNGGPMLSQLPVASSPLTTVFSRLATGQLIDSYRMKAGTQQQLMVESSCITGVRTETYESESNILMRKQAG